MDARRQPSRDDGRGRRVDLDDLVNLDGLR